MQQDKLSFILHELTLSIVLSIESGKILVNLVVDGSPDDGETLLQQLKKESTKTLQNEAALRWVVGADREKTLTLYLQSLPFSVATIRYQPE